MSCMALQTTALILLHLFFVAFFGASHATEADISCLKAIKSSFQDPYGYLNSSWNFDNQTEGFICRFRGVECWHPDENKVLNIILSDMGLKGNFPSGIKYCTSLTGLNLSNNSLSGTLPYDIAELLSYVTSLDLSHNNFSGQIPKGLANCSHLNVLDLSHNRLTGSLPLELGLLTRLRTFSVAYNLLSGRIPSSYRTNFTNESFADNPQLCGNPLDPCPPKQIDAFKDGFGIGFAVCFVAVLVVSSVTYEQVVNRARMILLSLMPTQKQAHRPIHLRSYSEHLLEIPGLERMVNRISFAELCSASDNFSEDNLIGTGKTGKMYKATLRGGQFLAVKKFHDSEEFESQFVSELLALGRLKHDNIVPLLGFCVERNEKHLVYKYMPNGSLHDWLHPARSEAEAKILEWPVRVKIAIGLARGLSWLHHRCNFRVAHLNISSKCVLLDDRFEPKISNFGKTIISNHEGAMVKYADEDDSGLLVSSGDWESNFVKEDVYKYGTLLIELVTSKETKSGGNNLVEWIDHVSTRPSMLDEVIDESLGGKGFGGEIMEVLRIAYECVQAFPDQRPTMLQLYERISNVGQRYEILAVE